MLIIFFKKTLLKEALTFCWYLTKRGKKLHSLSRILLISIGHSECQSYVVKGLLAFVIICSNKCSP